MRRENVSNVKALFEEKHIPEDFHAAKSRLRCKLVGREVYESTLKDLSVLHAKEQDFVLLPIFDYGTGYSRALPVEAARIWKRTADEIVQAALTETNKAYPPHLEDLGDDMYSLSAGNPNTDPEWYPFGTVIMALPGALRQVSDTLQADFYLTPDTPNEIMLFPIREGAEADPAELRRILCRIHASQAEVLSPDHSELILSDSVYLYRRGIGLTIA